MATNSEILNPSMDLQKSELWELESGKWQAESSGKGFKLVETNTGEKVSADLTNTDLQTILNLPQHPDNVDWLYPPEFSYCSETQTKLVRQDLSEEKPWIPPFGVLPINQRTKGIVRGLNQTDFSLNIESIGRPAQDISEDCNIKPPPNGNYHFFSIKANSTTNILVALDPKIGNLYAYLPGKKAWYFLSFKNILTLSGTEIEVANWRCESEIVEGETQLFLPTDNGLALLKLDVLSLSFNVEYFGGGKCIASPIYFGNSIWQPLMKTAGKIELLNYSLENKFIQTITLSKEQNLELTKVQAPISTSNFVVWICNQGQIILKFHPNGDTDLRFLKWPLKFQPLFTRGCCYLTKRGDLYQLGVNNTRPNFNQYVKLNDDSFESKESVTTRLCSGRNNFEMAIRCEEPPWEDLNNHNTSVITVMPLFESRINTNVLALTFNFAGDFENLLQKKEKLEACLLLYSKDHQTCTINKFVESEPWDIKIFIHNNCIWKYHSERELVIGWRLKNEIPEN